MIQTLHCSNNISSSKCLKLTHARTDRKCKCVFVAVFLISRKRHQLLRQVNVNSWNRDKPGCILFCGKFLKNILKSSFLSLHALRKEFCRMKKNIFSQIFKKFVYKTDIPQSEFVFTSLRLQKRTSP